MIGDAVMKMIDVFADARHSGHSAGMVIEIFSKLARFTPLTPLTGSADEWGEVYLDRNGNPVYQNNRCSTVFKEGDYVYNMDGKIFRKPSGYCYTSLDSRVPVTFPYYPKTEYVDVPESDDS